MGYYVPASSFSFCPVRQVFTLFSAGEDEEMQSSRMGGEIRIIADFLKQAQEHDLVLINEPLTSTNPVEAISLIIAVDPVVSMFRTVLNCTGDIVASAVAAKAEGLMDLERFRGISR